MPTAVASHLRELASWRRLANGGCLVDRAVDVSLP